MIQTPGLEGCGQCAKQRDSAKASRFNGTQDAGKQQSGKRIVPRFTLERISTICTKCGEKIEEKRGFFRTRKGPHHFKCGVAVEPLNTDEFVAWRDADTLIDKYRTFNRLTAALREIIAVASGEKQVAQDDTDGMAWIDKRARAAIE